LKEKEKVREEVSERNSQPQKGLWRNEEDEENI